MPQPFSVSYRPIGLGGVNNSVSDEFINDNELSDSSNYMPDSAGQSCLVKREGTADAVLDIGGTNYLDSIYQGITGTFYTAVVGSSSPYTYYILDSGSHLRHTATAGAISAFSDWTSFETYDLVANGTVALKTSDATTFSAIANIPSGVKFLKYANNFLYAAGHDYSKLRWANVGTIETWPSVNELVLNQDRNNYIVGLKEWRNALFILCRKSFYLISGFSNLEQGVSYFSREAGGTNHMSIVVTPVGIMWWSDSGVAILKPDLTIDYPMIRKIPKTFATFPITAGTYVHAAIDPQQQKVMFFAPVTVSGASGATGYVRMDYYYFKDTWFIHNGSGVNMRCSTNVSSSTSRSVWAGYSKVFYYSTALNTDDGTAISDYLETKREAYGGSNIYKHSRKVTLSLSGTAGANMNYGCYLDDETTVDTTWVNRLEADGADDITIGTNRHHTKIKHRISDSSLYRNKVLGLVHDGSMSRQF